MAYSEAAEYSVKSTQSNEVEGYKYLTSEASDRATMCLKYYRSINLLIIIKEWCNPIGLNHWLAKKILFWYLSKVYTKSFSIFSILVYNIIQDISKFNSIYIFKNLHDSLICSKCVLSLYSEKEINKIQMHACKSINIEHTFQFMFRVCMTHLFIQNVDLH